MNKQKFLKTLFLAKRKIKAYHEFMLKSKDRVHQSSVSMLLGTGTWSGGLDLQLGGYHSQWCAVSASFWNYISLLQLLGSGPFPVAQGTNNGQTVASVLINYTTG